jgi:hypothetical protein
LAAGGGQLDCWELYRRGLVNGTDPDHPEYWGEVNRNDQRMVELAAIAFALQLVPEHLWEPLDQAARDRVATYLLAARAQPYPANNWKFFRVLLDLALERCGIDFDRSLGIKALDEIDSYYIADGWYRDGMTRQLDHYIPFAMHFYGLLFARLQQGDDERAARFTERARTFAADIRHWFDDDGGALAFGRSLTYRFAMGAIWGAYAFAGIEALPWGEMKGYYLRHLRWWSTRPIADRDGILSVGYGYPNRMMSEPYNSAGSPYWAFKAFLPLALPADHPFWTAEELPPRFDGNPISLRHPGMVMMHTSGNVVALSSGQQNPGLRAGPEKYSKFVYSSRYAFSVENDDRGYDSNAFDGMLALSDDRRHYRVRETSVIARIAGDMLYSKWHPWPDVTVETWLKPAAPWHLRIHRITTPRPLHSTEGGFALPREDNVSGNVGMGKGFAVAHLSTDASAIADLGGQRDGRLLTAAPNTNLLASRTIVPQLRGEIPAGVTILHTAAVALPAGDEAEAAMKVAPKISSLAAIEGLFAWAGADISASRQSGSKPAGKP